MLENVLKEINSNLERIANSLEGKNIQNKIEVTSVPLVTETTNTTNTVVQEPIQNTVPISTIPTTQVQESFTQEQLAVAMSNAVSAGKMNIIQNILQQFGVQALTQINPADYNKVATMLKEAGVEL